MQSLMPPIDSSDNLFHNGNPLTGEKGTIVTADFLNDVQSALRDAQAELIAILSEASILPDGVTTGQVLAAIKRLLLARNNNFFVDTGTANNIVISPSPAFTALADGQTFDIACAAVNTGAVTLKVNAMAALPLVGSAGALQGGEIAAAKGVITVIWSASRNAFILMAQNTTGPFPVSPATKSNHAVNLGQLGAAALLGVASNSDMAAGTSTNLLSTAAGVMSLFSKRSFGQNDFIRIPDVAGGLIIQWGYVTISSGSSTAVTFPTPFPTNVLNVVATNAASTTPAASPGVGGLSATTFSLFGAKLTDGSPAGSGSSYFWVAIGR